VIAYDAIEIRRFSTIVYTQVYSMHGGLWSSGPDDVWIGTLGGPILRFDGNAWRAPVPKRVPLTAVWAGGANDAWLVGGVGGSEYKPGFRPSGVR
jgi:hypothetical protein